MLVLTRKVGESINIGDDIVIKVLEVNRNNVRIGIDAPKELSVLRQEVFIKIQEENILSTKGDANDLIEAARIWQQKDGQEQHDID